MNHYQAGGVKASHLRTPRMSSDASFTECYPSVHQTRRKPSLVLWSGWIAFALLLLLQVGR